MVKMTMTTSNSLSYKHNILAIFILSFVILYGLVLFALHVFSVNYQKKLFSVAQANAQLISDSVEDNLKYINLLSISIISSPEIQSQLRSIPEAKSDYENYLISDAITHKLEELLYSHTYYGNNVWIDDICLMSIDGQRTYASLYYGKNDSSIINDNLDEIVSLGGKSRWFISEGTKPNQLIFARTIRSTKNLDLYDLAVLAIYVDINDLINQTFRNYEYDEYDLTILQGQSVIFGHEDAAYQSLSDKITQSSGYFIDTVNGQRSLITYAVSGYNHWKYLYVIPYDSYLHQAYFTQNMLLLAFMGVFLLVLLISLSLLQRVTRPIERLSKNLKLTGDAILTRGILNIDISDSKPPTPMEQQLFNLINEINELITSNYVKQKEATQWELKALRAQIRPHFLFNTLDSINWIAAANNNDQVSDMAVALAHLLRNTIDKDDLILVADEIGLLQDYITIQKIRYGDRLDFRQNIDMRVYQDYIPRMILQPLVENSISYVLEKQEGVCVISVFSRLSADYFEIAVTDNGNGDFIKDYQESRLVPHGTGIGLSNIDNRIRLLFGDTYGLHLTRLPDGGTEVAVRFPYWEDKELPPKEQL